MSFKGSYRIDGHFQGTIVSDSMLVIGEPGKVEADVQVGYIVVNGEVKGTIRAEDKVEIHSRGRVVGSIITPKLVVDEGAYMEANCQAGESIAAASRQTDKPKEEASS